MNNQPKQPNSKRIYLDIPQPLWERLKAWIDRQGCQTDAEGIRAAIRGGIEDEERPTMWPPVDAIGQRFAIDEPKKNPLEPQMGKASVPADNSGTGEHIAELTKNDPEKQEQTT